MTATTLETIATPAAPAPKILLRKASDRGRVNLGWLDSAHSFSFGSYYDPDHMGFRSLRVINEDRVQPARGFPTHGHQDMEIITYVLEGALKHEDSLGNGSMILPGDVQRMSAGTGIQHSEFNASDRDLVHLLQIWILPDRPNLEPSYEQTHFPTAEKQGRWRLVAAPDGAEGAVTLHQDARILATVLAAGDRLTTPLDPSRHAWIQVARGAVTLSVGSEEITLAAGDAVALSAAAQLAVLADEAAELLWFDLA